MDGPMSARPYHTMGGPPLSPSAFHADDDEMRRAARLHAKKAMSTIASPVCNFEAFSLYFHLPLKAAAEKFGVRATAFKKRCRAIGIRHWPYRKVRSLKRSLQELNRCKDNGVLNDKQVYQYDTFKQQLDKLMSPETYGIDPSGQFLHAFTDDMDSGDDGMDSGDDVYSTMDSPRYGASFSDCSISPTDADKSTQSFVDYHPAAPPSFDKLPSLRKPTGLFHMQRSIHVPAEIHGLNLRLAKDTKSMDTYFVDEKQPQYADSDDEYFPDHHHPGIYAHAHPLLTDTGFPSDDIMLSDIKYDDDGLHDAVPHVGDYGNERFFDDVFLQISPDYGCLA